VTAPLFLQSTEAAILVVSNSTMLVYGLTDPKVKYFALNSAAVKSIM